MSDDDDDDDGSEKYLCVPDQQGHDPEPTGTFITERRGKRGDERVSKEYAGCRLRPVNA